MKTELLTHGSYKAVREVSVIFRAFAKKVKCLSSAKSENSMIFHFRHVIFVKNGLTKVKTLTFKRRLSNVTVVAEDSIIQHVIKSLMLKLYKRFFVLSKRSIVYKFLFICNEKYNTKFYWQ